MCVNNFSKVALDSAAAGIEPATSSRKSNALTTMPPSHTITTGSATNSTFSLTVSFLYKLLIYKDINVGVSVQYIEFRKVQSTGWRKKWHTFLYALTSYTLTSSNIGRFSNLFHC